MTLSLSNKNKILLLDTKVSVTHINTDELERVYSPDKAANDSIPNTFGLSLLNPPWFTGHAEWHYYAPFVSVERGRDGGGGGGGGGGRRGHCTKARQSFRGHCAYRRTHATRCIISRNGTLTPCLWSPLRRKEPHKADEQRCLRKTDKLLEPRKGNEFCRYGIEIAGLVFPAVKTNGWTRS